MISKIENVCVVGSGIMGCNIAAHLTNVGLHVLLLDQASKTDDKNLIVKKNLNIFSKAKPGIFYDSATISNISIGNLDDDIKNISKYDWVIEAIIENIAIKKSLFLKIDSVINSSTTNKDILVSSNTSGLSVTDMCSETSKKFKKNFMVTHFFNPVRYMHLLEIVSNEFTSIENIDFISDFCERILGKGIIHAKESPNFIANRIGTYAILKTLALMKKHNKTVEEVDYMLGEQVGKPKSAVFKTVDIVGLDTFSHVVDNCYLNLKQDEEHNIFVKPDIFEKMIANKMLGRKSKQGFYKKKHNSYEVLDLSTCLYNSKKNVKYKSIEEAKNIDDLKSKIFHILTTADEASFFVKDLTFHTCIYAVNRIFEISNSVEDIDNAMKWGFNWKIGPFETCDVIGIKEMLDFAKKNNSKIPLWLKHKSLLKQNSFYMYENDKKKVWDPNLEQYVDAKFCSKNKANFLHIKTNKKNILKKYSVTNLVDLNDGVVACEFSTKLNSIDFDVLTDIEKSLDFCEKYHYKSLVLYNEGDNFSVGMNLWLIFMGIQAKQWSQIENMCKKYQDLCVRLKYSPIFTVAAPFNLTLGGGAELSMWCNAIESHAELYMGLVEAGVGLIPGAGGTVELVSRTLKNHVEDEKIPLDVVLSSPLETVAMGKVGLSAIESKKLNFLTNQDGITINKDLHLESVKLCAIKQVNSGFINPSRRTFRLPGKEGFSNFKLMLNSMYKGGFVSKHDFTIALKLAYLVSGGQCNAKHFVSEQYLLDLERELFLSLCGEKKTLERIEHMLKNKKPLRN